MTARNRISSWVLRQLAWALLLAGLGLTGVGLWLFLHAPGDFEQTRRDTARTLTGELAGLRTAQTDVAARLAAGHIELAAQRARAAQAAKVAIDLEALNSGFNRLTTSSDQLRANEEGRARMRQMVADANQRAGEIEEALVRAQWEKDGLEIAQDRKQKQLAAVTAQAPAVWHYAREAWTLGGKPVLVAVALVVVATALWRARRGR